MANKQSNLFSFFSKTPQKPSDTKTPRKEVLSLRPSPNTTKEPPPKEKDVKSESEFQAGDVVWAKLEGYPWWPSVVCDHPTQNKHYKGSKTPQIHVQFFDSHRSRAWVKSKYVKPFKGSDDKELQRGGQFHCHNADCYEGAVEADKALKMSAHERLLLLIVDLQPSENEESAEEATVEVMDFDSDIFDDEMGEDETDNSKENHQNESIKTQDSKSPGKTPNKKKQPSRLSKSQKRRRIMLSGSGDEESGDEFRPESSGSDDSVSSGVDENDVSEAESVSDSESPVKAGKRKRSMSTPKLKPAPSNQPTIAERLMGSVLSGERRHSFKPAVTDKTKTKLSFFTAETSMADSCNPNADFPHLKLDFLQTENIRDVKGRRKSDDDYDPRTLHVPEVFMKKTTPAMRQWWELKANHFDTVLFFKMGKFYELFHMDAVIGVQELGLIYMKGDHAHSGFPEIAYTRYSDSLIEKGYKVARVEQTETPDMMTERCKQMSRATTKFDKVVKREVCQITSKGTKTYRHTEGDCGNMNSNYLLAVAEKECGLDENSVYGVCFIDTSIGTFHLGQFTDDRHCSRLRTLIAHHTPSLVLYERGMTSTKTLHVINTNLPSSIKEPLASCLEFWDSSKTLKTLAEDYFTEDGEEFVWPGDLKDMMSQSDALGLTAADNYDQAVRALGAVTWYLQYSLLDQELFTMKRFVCYQPVDCVAKRKKSSSDFSQKHMVLDGVTLKNLDLVGNSGTGTSGDTLLEKLDHCCTPFGKRLLHQWLCAPLCQPSAINDRLDAVEDLMRCQELLADTVEVMKKLPDLERLLSRIHTLGSAARSKKHPDSRAIMYEEVTYSKRKIEDFLATLTGFKTALDLTKKFEKYTSDFKSRLLRRTVSVQKSSTDKTHFPDIAEDIKFFQAAFDHDKARKDGTIIPSKGVNMEYDQAVQDIKSTEKSFVRYLDNQRDRLRCMAMVYWGSGKNRYQMEVPEMAWKRVPDDYELTSSKKGWKRYHTPDIEEMLAELTEAEDRKVAALKDTMRKIFHSFDERHKKWRDALDCLSVLDVIISLVQYTHCANGVTCRPEIVLPEEGTEPFLELREARHPCVTRTFSGGDFIPNDTVIGMNDNEEEEDPSYSNSRIVLVTGPNMGGKSTLMRQVGLITVMAQMGCHVPATKCRLTPVDRVFTRLGASDRIMSGESTFYVELSETTSILQHATKHSLVLMDELGRGTATYDGTAIACSVVQELSNNVRCRTLFSTHYHSLVEEFNHDVNVRLGHMACVVENGNEEDPSQELITFLYKFVKGACPKSYGFNAARLANIPEEVIKSAVMKAKEFEESSNRLKLLKSLWSDFAADSVRALQQVA